MKDEETRAQFEFENLRGYSVSYFIPKLKFPESETILYEVFEGDPVKSQKSKIKIKRRIILDYYYKQRVSRLNEILSSNEQLRRIKNDNH